MNPVENVPPWAVDILRSPTTGVITAVGFNPDPTFPVTDHSDDPWVDPAENIA